MNEYIISVWEMVKIKKLFVLLFVILGFGLYAEEIITAKEKTNILDISVKNVDVFIQGDDGDSIRCYTKLEKSSKLSIVEVQDRLRIRDIYPAKGLLHILVPKKLLLASAQIRVTNASLKIESVQAVWTLLMVNEGNAEIKDCVFKTSTLTQAEGTLHYDAKILRSSVICMNSVKAAIQYIGTPENYRLTYGQGNSDFTINGAAVKNAQGIFGAENAKKGLIISAGSSSVKVEFKAKSEE
ncbi:hypothetical protein DWQ65_10615 [Treponema phagedenis]|uniref:Adhesin domain-containing protein n=2 Tax=Treponema phagedenis TaxID=162 RepID=A0AAE6IWG9_TREPH|nr:hypothetical protein [Treponema phagedenis]NVP24024.1 hypothetical protein [Treponema phagedenis]QEJ99408.1 hypothetical protein FUT82_16380 [Treponema phagedenis]QSH94978.1 hypothetical protein C5O78_07985 [Treponema phagedenis]QSI00499.1 hypothetical protein DWQ65_10615 [Treponema phagedenis]